jgi:apolipoprotein N-acyltransferase
VRLLPNLAPPPGVGWVALSGLVLGLAHPPFHFLLPSFLGLVPFGIWLARLPEGDEGRVLAFRGGLWLGIVYYTILLYWLATALIFYSLLAVLAFVVAVGLLCLFLAVATTGMHHVRRRLGWPVWISLPVFWTAAEWFRAHLGPISFPWQELGYTLTGFPSLIGAADLVGARGLSFWLALLSGLLAAAFVAWRQGHRGRAWLALGGWILGVTVPVSYSLWRWQTLEMRPIATVTVVQPNVPEQLKLEDPVAAFDSARSSIEHLLAGHEPAQDVDLLILPETVIPRPIDPILAQKFMGRPDIYQWVTRLARSTDAPVLFGSIGIENRSQEEWDYYNSAFLIDERGARRARYDKQYLVPVVERVPFLDPAWFTWAEYFGGFSVGRNPDVVALDGGRLGVLICYESIFSGLSRDYRLQGADFLVNITNDAWFGREWPPWSRSSALWQHPSHLVLRAIENRIGIARAGNTGISETVDPLGRVQGATELFTPSIFTADLLTTDGLTLFARVGDVVGWIAALAAAVGVILPRIGRRSS